ncbi:DUF1206 domain-containing protein [Arthrobacter sp. USHLN218]|uniref:DUF1206 domain-containing protein n=1 Tax=Arthrobacter sp. USHLN218 TaxID=3081232 RepID=UPI003018F814
MSGGVDRAKREARRAKDTAEEASESKTLEIVARFGWAASGLLHVLIGVLALRLALGASGEADQAGAVSELSSKPGGALLIWAGMIACAALALWQFSDAAFGYRHLEDKKKWGKRAKAVGLGIVFAAISSVFGVFAFGGSSDSSETSQDASSKLLQFPGGAIVLFLIGAGIAAAGIFYVYKGIVQKFLDDLKTLPPGAQRIGVSWLGTFGYIGKGAALVVLGILFSVAALHQDPEQAKGLDGALKALKEQPFGDAALILIAVGLMCYGLYLGARARYGKM